MTARTSRRGHVSVVICVYTEDRWDDILAAVESVARADVPAARDRSWSSTTTRACCARAAARASPSRDGCVPATRTRGPVRRPQHRRRRRHRRVVAFLDDDAVAEPDWLRALSAGYADPAVVAVGGVAHPRCRRAAAGAQRGAGLFPTSSTGSSAAPTAGMPDRAGRGPQPDGRQHVLPPRGLRRGRRLRRGHRAGRHASRWAARRPSCASGCGRPGAAPGGADRVRARRAGRPPGGRRARALVVPAASQLVGGAVEGGGGPAGRQRRRAVHRAELRRRCCRARCCASCGRAGPRRLRP